METESGESPITCNTDPVIYTRNVLTSNNTVNMQTGQEVTQMGKLSTQSSMVTPVVDGGDNTAHILMELPNRFEFLSGTDIQFLVIEAEDSEQLVSTSGESYQIISEELNEQTAGHGQRLLGLEQVIDVKPQPNDNCDCDICNRILVGPFSQFRYMRCQNASANVLWCLYCQFCTELRSDLNRHVAVEHGLDPDGRRLKDIDFNCVTSRKVPICEDIDNGAACEDFVTKSHEEPHHILENITSRNFTEYNCSLCTFKTEIPYSLQFHLRTIHKLTSNDILFVNDIFEK